MDLAQKKVKKVNHKREWLILSAAKFSNRVRVANFPLFWKLSEGTKCKERKCGKNAWTKWKFCKIASAEKFVQGFPLFLFLDVKMFQNLTGTPGEQSNTQKKHHRALWDPGSMGKRGERAPQKCQKMGVTMGKSHRCLSLPIWGMKLGAWWHNSTK